ncbi:hypothetical protein ACHAW6_011781 [Cyclotella cf. meneghiniana]
MAENQRLNGITTPHANDVLSGRGNLVNRHPGNEHFRSLVKQYKEEYVSCPKSRKAMYSKLIYNDIRSLHPPGRFLKQDPNTKIWNDIGKKTALAKARQALREGAPELLRDLQTFEHFRLHSTSESNLGQAANFASTVNAIYTPPAESNNQIKPILSRYVWRSSSAESMGDESLSSLNSISHGMTNDATKISSFMSEEVSRSFAEVPAHSTWKASSSESGEGTSALLQVGHNTNQMQIMYQPSNPWQRQSSIPSMLQNYSTQTPESHLDLAMFNTSNELNRQRKLTASNSIDPINQFTNCSFKNVLCLNSAGTSQQQQRNVINYVSGYCNASIDKSTINTGTENTQFVNSATPSHRQQNSIINNLSGNHNAPINQFTMGTGIENDPFVHSVSQQQQCTVINNLTGNENANCLWPLFASLSSNNPNVNNNTIHTQFLNYQAAHQHLMTKWNAQQNPASEGGDETGCTPLQNSWAKSA